MPVSMQCAHVCWPMHITRTQRDTRMQACQHGTIHFSDLVYRNKDQQGYTRDGHARSNLRNVQIRVMKLVVPTHAFASTFLAARVKGLDPIQPVARGKQICRMCGEQKHERIRPEPQMSCTRSNICIGRDRAECAAKKKGWWQGSYAIPLCRQTRVSHGLSSHKILCWRLTWRNYILHARDVDTLVTSVRGAYTLKVCVKGSQKRQDPASRPGQDPAFWR